MINNQTDEPQIDGDEWLRKYTMEGINNFPGQKTIKELLAKYPFDGGVLYRGMNFDNKVQWDQFLESSNNGTEYLSGDVSSWSKSESTATQFSLTKPTYFLNRDLIQAESLKNKNRDFMIGHVGVVLKITVEPGFGIDITKSMHDKENEVIMQPGRYKAEIHKTMTPYMQSINEDNYGFELLNIKNNGNLSSDPGKLDHILNRFKIFSNKEKSHIFNLIKGDMEKIETQVNVYERHDPVSRHGNHQIPEIYVGWSASPDLFDHYDKFLPKDQAIVNKCLSIAAESIDQKFDLETKNFDWKNKSFYINLDRSVADAIDRNNISVTFPLKVNKAVGLFYNQWNSMEKIKAINSLNGREKMNAINEQSKRIKIALEQMIKLPNSKLKLQAMKSINYINESEVDKFKKVTASKP
jgi:hypothetical protein